MLLLFSSMFAVRVLGESLGVRSGIFPMTTIIIYSSLSLNENSSIRTLSGEGEIIKLLQVGIEQTNEYGNDHNNTSTLYPW
jgi:hypothetical protein